MKNNKKIILSIFLLIFLLFGNFLFFNGITPETLRDYIGHFKYLSPLIYILSFIILPIGFFPVPVLALAGGLLFGFIPGTIYTLIGAALNSSIMFLMAKVLARDLITSLIEKKLSYKWSNLLRNTNGKKGFIIILILRLIPAMPYNLINYMAGLTSITFINYIFATMVGILPGTLVFLNIGNQSLNMKNSGFTISILLLFVLTGLSLLLGKSFSKSHSIK